VLFTPQVIAKQLMISIALEAGAMTAEQLYHVCKGVTSRFSSRSRKIRQLESQQNTATTQDEWMNIAEQIDAMQGNDIWRSEPECQLYEADRVSARIDEFVHLMRRRDIFDLMFTLRGGIARNKFGLLHEGLFTRALAGSKVLIETYHNVICASLEFICDAPVSPGDDPIPTDARLAFFNESRHAYGRTAMMFSGGAALGFFHVGVAKALLENGLMPRVLSGASAGSIVCAMIGTRTAEECTNDLFQVKGTDAPGHSGRLKLDFFRPIRSKNFGNEDCDSEDSDQQIKQVYTLNRIWQLLFPAVLRNFTSHVFDIARGRSKVKDMLMSDTEHFRECCRVNIGDFTFQEAFDRSGRILNITVSPQNRSDPPRLLNYLTAPHVLVWSAAVASSSLPGVFESNRLLVRDADGTERFESATGVRFLDGSMEADLPMQQLSEMFNINHFIISQVNPHAVMFSDLGLNHSIWTSQYIKFAGGILSFIKNQVKAWIRNVVELIGGSRVAPIWETRRGFLTQFFTQEYVGRDIDITLNPWAGHMSLLQSFFYLLYNPSEIEFKSWVESAERETWRHIPRLKSHMAVEVTLDRCVQKLRRRVVVESWEAKQLSRYNASEVDRGHATKETMGRRVPSFYTSPSLVNFGGLNVGDQDYLHEWASSSAGSKQINAIPIKHGGGLMNGKLSAVGSLLLSDEVNPGWGGKGLRGNFSGGSLVRQNSMGSGLFVMDNSDDEEEDGTRGDAEQEDKSKRIIQRNHSSLHDLPTFAKTHHGNTNYIKTTNMANFYYRKIKSHDNLREQQEENLEQTR